jgi:hypothetical protein
VPAEVVIVITEIVQKLTLVKALAKPLLSSYDQSYVKDEHVSCVKPGPR